VKGEGDTGVKMASNDVAIRMLPGMMLDHKRAYAHRTRMKRMLGKDFFEPRPTVVVAPHDVHSDITKVRRPAVQGLLNAWAEAFRRVNKISGNDEPPGLHRLDELRQALKVCIRGPLRDGHRVSLQSRRFADVYIRDTQRTLGWNKQCPLG